MLWPQWLGALIFIIEAFITPFKEYTTKIFSISAFPVADGLNVGERPVILSSMASVEEWCEGRSYLVLVHETYCCVLTLSLLGYVAAALSLRSRTQRRNHFFFSFHKPRVIFIIPMACQLSSLISGCSFCNLGRHYFLMIYNHKTRWTRFNTFSLYSSEDPSKCFPLWQDLWQLPTGFCCTR